MPIKIGNNSIGKVYIGNKEVTDFYRGATTLFQNIQFSYFYGDYSAYENVQTCTPTGSLVCDETTYDEVNSPVEIECQCLFSAWSSYSSTSSATATSPACDTGVVQREVQTRTRSCTGSPNQCVYNSCCTGSPNQCVYNSCCTTSSYSCNCTTSYYSCNCTTSSVCSGGSFGSFGAWTGYDFSTSGSTSWSCTCSRCGQTGVNGECQNLFGGTVCRRRYRTCNCSYSNQTTCQTCSSTSCQTCTRCNASSCCTTTNTCVANSCCTTTNTCSCGSYSSWSNTSSCSSASNSCGQTRQCQQRTRTGQNQQRSRTCQRIVV